MAKLPGSTYAMAATNAGPSIVSVARNGPLREHRPRAGSACTRSSPLDDGRRDRIGTARRGAHSDAHRPCEHGAEDVHLVADADVERAVERLALDHLDAGARRDAALGEEAEHRRIGVGDAHERAVLARLERVQAAAVVRRDRQVAARDRIAVRVERRVAELRRDELLELLRDDVLEHLGLGVHLVPAHAEALDEVQLEQAVVADDLEGDAAAAGRSAATPRYGSWTTRPSPVSFRSIPETEPGRTPSRSARAFVDTVSSRDSSV